MKKAVMIVVVLVLAIAGGAAIYKLNIRPSLQKISVIKAGAFFSLNVNGWEIDYHEGKKSLPTPYPRSLDDLATYGYLEQGFIKILTDGLKVTYYAPPKDIPPDYVLIKIESPAVTWVVRLKKSTIYHGSGHFDGFVAMHEKL